MIYKLVVSKEADEDIEDIVLFIVSELNNPSAASAFLDDVEKSYNNIVEKPAMYSLCNDYRLRIVRGTGLLTTCWGYHYDLNQ